MKGTRRLPPLSHWIVLGILGLGLAGHAFLYDYVVDDAFISFRYAENLTRGEGLVYNPGERVEGFTNFLWVMLAALALAVGGDPVSFSQTAGLLAAEGLLVLVFLWPGRAELRGNTLRLLAPALLCLSPPFALWAVGGLETCFFVLLVYLGLAVGAGARGRASRDVLAGLLLALATLTRPEGILAVFVVALDRMVWPGSQRSVRERFSLPLLATYLAIVVPYEIWRWTYYGFLLPNSFYAKVGWSWAQMWRGLGYLAGFAAGFGWAALVLGVVGLAGGLRDCVERLLALWGALYVVYVAVVGGDGLGMYRFIVPLLPALYLLAARGILVIAGMSRPASPTGRRWAGAVLCLLLGFVVVRPTIASPEKEFVERDKVFVEKHWTAIGKWLRSYAQPGESIAVTTAGAVAFYSGLYTIDMLGINEPAIARRSVPDMGAGIAGHEKHDMDYVLSRRPTYLFHHLFLLNRPGFTREQFVTPWNPGEEELLTSPVFARLYEPVSENVGRFYINFFRLRRIALEDSSGVEG